MIGRNLQIGDRAGALKIVHRNGNLVDFYRSHRDSRAFLGFEYLVGGDVGLNDPGGFGARAVGRPFLEKLCRTKEADFHNFTMQSQQPQQHHIIEQEQSCCNCLIL